MYSALPAQGAHISHLLEFVGDHGKSLEDGIGGAGDGHNSLRAVSLRDVDSCPALQKRRAALEQPQPGKLGGMCWRHSSFFGLYPACPGKAQHTTVGTQRAGQKSSGGSQLGCPCRKAEYGVTATRLSQGNEPSGQLWPWFCMLLALPTPHPSITNYFMVRAAHLLTHLLHGLSFLKQEAETQVIMAIHDFHLQSNLSKHASLKYTAAQIFGQLCGAGPSIPM